VVNRSLDLESTYRRTVLALCTCASAGLTPLDEGFDVRT